MADSIFKQMGSIVRTAIDSSKITIENKTSDFVAENNRRYIIDTTNDFVNVTLPESPQSNNYIEFVDFKQKFETNNVVLNGNGSKINGSSESFNLDGTNVVTGIIYSGDVTTGWVVSVSGVKQTEPAILLGNTVGVSDSKINILISNYNSGFNYNVNVSGGSYIINDDTINWTLPSIDNDERHQCSVMVTEPGKTSSIPVFHYVDVEVIEVDDGIIVENSDWDGFGEELINVIENDKIISIGKGSYLTNSIIQEEFDSNFSKQKINIRIKGEEFTVLDNSTVSSIHVSGYFDDDSFYETNNVGSIILVDHNNIAEISQNFGNSIIEKNTASLFNSGSTSYISSTLIDENKICVSYRDSGNSGYGTSRIGIIVGDTISWGDEYIFNSGSTSYISSTLIDENKICVSYQDLNIGTSIIGTINGNIISWGSPYVFNSENTYDISSSLIDKNKICISYRDYNNSNYGTSIIGIILGDDTISWGAEYIFNSAQTEDISSIKIDDNKICVSYRDFGNSSRGTSIIGTISGNIISWGSPYFFNTGSTSYISSTLIDDNKICISYRDGGNSGYGTSIIGTISGNTISWGSKYVFKNDATNYISSTKIAENKICVSYQNYNNGMYGCSIIGTVSGDAISWGNDFVFAMSDTYDISSTLIDDDKICVFYSDDDNSDRGTSIILTMDVTSVLTLNNPLNEIPVKIFKKQLPKLYSFVGLEKEILNNEDIELNNISNVSNTGLTVTSTTENLLPEGIYNKKVGLVISNTKILTDILSIAENKLYGNESEYIFNSGNTTNISTTLIDDNKICVSYRDNDNSGYGISIIGTISGDTISWGSEYVFNSGSTYDISSTKIDDNKICVSYRDGGYSYRGTSIIGTISGNTISWGSEYIFNNGSTSYISSTLIDENKICVFYRDESNANYGTSIIGTISGNTISWGSEYVFNTGTTFYISSTLIDDNKICVSYQDYANSYYGTSIIGTISGNTISWGSEYVFNSENTYDISSTLIDENKICISYRDSGNSGYGTSIIGIISGTSISWGIPYVFNSGSTSYISSTLIDENKICVSYCDGSNSSYGTSRIGIIDGDTISWGSEYVFKNDNTNYISSTKIAENKICVSYQDYYNSYYGTSKIIDFNIEYIITYADQGSIPTAAWKPPVIKTEIDIPIDFATTSSITTSLLREFNPNIDKLDLIVNKNNINNISINSVITNIGDSFSDISNEYIFNENGTYDISVILIDENKICVSYRDNGNSYYGTSIIGIISGDTISWGNPFVFNTGTTYDISSTLVDENKICISYQDRSRSYYGISIIGTIDGNTLSWGTETVFNSGNTYNTSTTLIDTNKICVSYRDYSNSNYGTSIIGTISGNTISWGSEYVFNSGTTYDISSTLIDTNKICISYRDHSNSGYGTSIIGTISGTSIGWGSEYVFNSGTSYYTSTILIDTNKICISYRDHDNSGYGNSIIGTISGNTISWGSPYVFNTGNVYEISSTKIADNKIFISYRDNDNSSYGLSIIGTISGDTISWGSESIFNNRSTLDISSTKIADNKICISYQDETNSGYGISRILEIDMTKTLNFDVQSAIPTKANLSANSLMPANIVYNRVSEYLTVEYDEETYLVTDNIRQLKYMMEFNEANQEWLRLQVDLFTDKK